MFMLSCSTRDLLCLSLPPRFALCSLRPHHLADRGDMGGLSPGGLSPGGLSPGGLSPGGVALYFVEQTRAVVGTGPVRGLSADLL